MKIFDIMTPWNGTKYIVNGIRENSDLNDLKTSDITFENPSIEVIAGEGRKVGEVDRDLLLYLINASNTWIFNNIVDNYNDAVIVIDTQGRIFYLNDAYSKILGVPVCKIIGKQIQQVEPGAEILNVLNTKAPIIKEKPIYKNIGQICFCAYISSRTLREN